MNGGLTVTISLACIKGSWSRHLDHAVEAQYFLYVAINNHSLIISRSDLLLVSMFYALCPGLADESSESSFRVLGSAFKFTASRAELLNQRILQPRLLHCCFFLFFFFFLFFLHFTIFAFRLFPFAFVHKSSSSLMQLTKIILLTAFFISSPMKMCKKIASELRT